MFESVLELSVRSVSKAPPETVAVLAALPVASGRTGAVTSIVTESPASISTLTPAASSAAVPEAGQSVPGPEPSASTSSSHRSRVRVEDHVVQIIGDRRARDIVRTGATDDDRIDRRGAGHRGPRAVVLGDAQLGGRHELEGADITARDRISVAVGRADRPALVGQSRTSLG